MLNDLFDHFHAHLLYIMSASKRRSTSKTPTKISSASKKTPQKDVQDYRQYLINKMLEEDLNPKMDAEEMTVPGMLSALMENVQGGDSEENGK